MAGKQMAYRWAKSRLRERERFFRRFSRSRLGSKDQWSGRRRSISNARSKVRSRTVPTGKAVAEVIGIIPLSN